jgi:hypothetical protein
MSLSTYLFEQPQNTWITRSNVDKQPHLKQLIILMSPPRVVPLREVGRRNQIQPKQLAFGHGLHAGTSINRITVRLCTRFENSRGGMGRESGQMTLLWFIEGPVVSIQGHRHTCTRTPALTHLLHKRAALEPLATPRRPGEEGRGG